MIMCPFVMDVIHDHGKSITALQVRKALGTSRTRNPIDGTVDQSRAGTVVTQRKRSVLPHETLPTVMMSVVMMAWRQRTVEEIQGYIPYHNIQACRSVAEDSLVGGGTR